MSEIVKWSELPEDLVDLIANHLFSSVELLRVRGICKPWRSAVDINKRFPNHRKLHRRRLLSPYKETPCSLSPAGFFRVVLSSCPNKGWLIKTQDAKEKEDEEEEDKDEDEDEEEEEEENEEEENEEEEENKEEEEVSEFRKNLLFPFSRLSIKPSDQTLNLLDFTVTEIHQSYGVYLDENRRFMSYRSVLVDDLVFAVDYNNKIWWCNSEEEEGSNNDVWTRLLDEEAKLFSDIIVYKGQIYALDLKGAIWWISLSDFDIFQYGPSTPLEYYEIDDCKDRRLVEYCGDLCIVHRFCKNFRGNVERTIGFKVFKMDVELVEWVEVKSLGDKALVMAMDSCLCVLASEYYGCLEDAIYFSDEEDKKNNIKVFKLGSGSILNMADSSSEACFQMFSPPNFA